MIYIDDNYIGGETAEKVAHAITQLTHLELINLGKYSLFIIRWN